MSNKSQTPGSRSHKKKEELHPSKSLIVVTKQENNMQETVWAGSESKSDSSESDSSSSDDDSDSTPTKLSQAWFMQVDFSNGQPLNKESKNKEDASTVKEIAGDDISDNAKLNLSKPENDIEKLSVIDKSIGQTEDDMAVHKSCADSDESNLPTVDVGTEFLNKPKLRGPVHDDELDLAIRLIYL